MGEGRGGTFVSFNFFQRYTVSAGRTKIRSLKPKNLKLKNKVSDRTLNDIKYSPFPPSLVTVSWEPSRVWVVGDI